MFRSALLYMFILALVLITVSGCNEDDPMTVATGRAVITSNPGTLDAPWILKLPDGLVAMGEGNGAVEDLPTGHYLLTWQDVEGWRTPTPNPVSKYMPSGATLSFTGTYLNLSDQLSSIDIDADPDSLDATWTLYGPDDFMQQGSGSLTLSDMPIGDYRIEWDDVDDFLTPDAQDETLVAGVPTAFHGTYILKTADIAINPVPVDGGWQIEGPGGFNETGTGDGVFTGKPVGAYTITWSEVLGYVTPVPETKRLSGYPLTFTGLYIEDGSPDGFMQIESGAFTMGSPVDEINRGDDETQHEVTLSRGFRVQATEVTNKQYCDILQWAFDRGLVFIDSNRTAVYDTLSGTSYELLRIGSVFCNIDFLVDQFTCTNPEKPGNMVTWYGAASYCDWLNMRSNRPQTYDHSDWSVIAADIYQSPGYRLPSEAEWEYVCRAGTSTAFNTGACLNADYEANYDGSNPLGDCPAGVRSDVESIVGSYPSNVWGLADTHGNLMEWCQDGYQPYATGSVTDPVGVGDTKVLRGGSWGGYADACRSANRYALTPGFASRFIGFRVVR